MPKYIKVDIDLPIHKEMLLWAMDVMQDDEIVVYCAMTHGFDLELENHIQPSHPLIYKYDKAQIMIYFAMYHKFDLQDYAQGTIEINDEEVEKIK